MWIKTFDLVSLKLMNKLLHKSTFDKNISPKIKFILGMQGVLLLKNQLVFIYTNRNKKKKTAIFIYKRRWFR